MLNSARSESDSSVLSQAETDALLEAVSEQLDLDRFDPTNHQLLKQMVESLGDTRGLIRLSFAEALGDIGEPATPFLIEALSHHPNPVVRRAAGKTLTLIADPKAVPTLVHALLHDDDTVVKGSVVGALARTGAAAVPALLAILASSDYPESAKGHAAWALSFIGAEAAEYLYAAMDSDSVDVRCAVVGAIGSAAQENADERAYSLLMAALHDPEAVVRTEAASAFGKLNYAAAVPALIAATQDSDGEVRKAAVSSLGKLGDPAAIEPLQAALTDELDVVRRLAKIAIGQIERQAEWGE
jgi:bilin biosynthesis protein